MPDCSDACCAVHIEADITLVCDDRLAGVDAHANADRASVQSRLTVASSRKRIRCAGKRDEEPIALRVDLHAIVTAEHVPKHTPMGGERIRVRVAELLEQPCRALDVREQEGPHHP